MTGQSLGRHVFRGCAGRREVVQGRLEKTARFRSFRIFQRPQAVYRLSAGKKISKRGERSEPNPWERMEAALNYSSVYILDG